MMRSKLNAMFAAAAAAVATNDRHYLDRIPVTPKPRGGASDPKKRAKVKQARKQNQKR